MVHSMADSKASGFSKVVQKHSLRAKERVSFSDRRIAGVCYGCAQCCVTVSSNCHHYYLGRYLVLLPTWASSTLTYRSVPIRCARRSVSPCVSSVSVFSASSSSASTTTSTSLHQPCQLLPRLNKSLVHLFLSFLLLSELSPIIIHCAISRSHFVSFLCCSWCIA